MENHHSRNQKQNSCLMFSNKADVNQNRSLHLQTPYFNLTRLKKLAVDRHSSLLGPTLVKSKNVYNNDIREQGFKTFFFVTDCTCHWHTFSGKCNICK